MRTSTRRRSHTYSPSDGSRTQIITTDPTKEEGDHTSDGENVVGSIRLRGEPRRTHRVIWSEDVVDNEGMGKKKSKICCIYHKPRQFDESSSEESSDSDSDSDGECRHNHNHDHDHDHTHGPSQGESSGGQRQTEGSSNVVTVPKEHEEPNAYETQPPSKKGKHRAT